MNPDATSPRSETHSRVLLTRTAQSVLMPPVGRRKNTMTDDTIDSLTPSFREAISFNNYASNVLTTNATAEETLRGYLSSGTIVSTTSSFARRHHAAQDDVDSQLFSEIGCGSYGIVFERPGTLEVVKRPVNLRGPPDNTFHLWNDYVMHTKIYESFQAQAGHLPKVHIPRPLQFVSANNREWWAIWSSKFEIQYQVPAPLLFTERVLPVPRPVRDALADCFCPEQYRAATKESSKNKHCLIHPLLGRRKGGHSLRGMMNLRNFELCIDQMEFLGMDIDNIVDVMAESLAVLHFKAHVDAHDIEFVFGTAPTPMHNVPRSSEELEKMTPFSHVTPVGSGWNFHGRVVHLWIIDFNRVSKIPRANEFLPMALKGFVDQSKAYYPRPRFTSNSNDNRYWERFKSAYVRSSGDLCGSQDARLPTQFLKAVEDHYSTVETQRSSSRR